MLGENVSINFAWMPKIPSMDTKDEMYPPSRVELKFSFRISSFTLVGHAYLYNICIYEYSIILMVSTLEKCHSRWKDRNAYDINLYLSKLLEEALENGKS